MSAIEWTDDTWNPVLGCDPITAGCALCYAPWSNWMVVRTRGEATPHAKAIEVRNGVPRFNGRVVRNTDEKFYWIRSIRPRTPPRKIFVASLSDVFHEAALRQGLTHEIFAEMRAYPGHIYQLFTKRPDAALAFFRENPQFGNLPGVWFGASVEDQRVLWRIDSLRQIRAEVRALSLEPLIGPLANLNLDGIGWVIIGGESAGRGQTPRPMNADWARDIRNQCVAAGVPLFFKQWGGPRHNKRGAGEAVLDGREWKEFPV